MSTSSKKVTKPQAFFMLILGIVLVVVGFLVTEDADAVILLSVGALLSVIAVIFGTKYRDIQSTIITLVKNMIMPILIIFSVGMMIGTWVLSGTVPIMVYYGIQIISPSLFYFLTCLICTIMALIMGSSWGTISTVGIAFLGMASGLGMSPVITAGAIASGALCGDKLSPMSDSPNVSTAVSKVNLFEGCIHAAKTSLPALVICLVYFLILGFNNDAAGGGTGTEAYDTIVNGLSSIYNLNPLLLLPPVVVIVLIIMKKPILPTFAVGIVLGAVLSMIFQSASIGDVASVMMNGYGEATGVDLIDSIILRGGLSSFLEIAAILIAACVFGAPLRAAGVIDALLDLITTTSKSSKSMVVKVYGMCLTFFVITGGYDLTYAALGPMLPDLFDKYHLHRKNLSRILQDCTISLSPMIPWGGMGAFYAATLGVANSDFFIYAPLTWLSTLIGFIYVLTGFTMTKVTDEEIAAQDAALEA